MVLKSDGWDSDTEIYTANEVESVLSALGISPVDETQNDFLSFCPYHGNTHDPAFSTSKRYGYSVCFNPACAKGASRRLTLDGLVRDIKGLNHFESKRFMKSAIARSGAGSFEEKMAALSEPEPEEMVEFPLQAIETMHNRLLSNNQAIQYMKGRGFDRNTVEHFKVGFAPAAMGWDVPVYRPVDMIMVPAYTHLGKPVGLIGRSLEGKEFKNYGADKGGKGFHKSQVIWNLQNARKYESIILTEASFDAMSIHQAGYPNVGALLGGSLSTVQRDLLNRHFNHVIIMTDNETTENGGMTYNKRCAKCLRERHDMCQGHKPGRDLGMKIAESLPRMKISWGFYDDKNIFARGVKDANAMDGDEIRQTLRNAVSHFEYLEWQS